MLRNSINELEYQHSFQYIQKRVDLQPKYDKKEIKAYLKKRDNFHLNQ